MTTPSERQPLTHIHTYSPMPKLASKPVQQPAAPTGTTLSPPAANEPSWLSGPALKAATEHLFATQRAKKAGDRAKGKAHGAGSGGGRPSSPAVRSTASMEKKVWAEVWEAAADDGDWPELPTPPLPPLMPALRATQDRCEVPLSALVRPVKMRGVKAKGALTIHSMLSCHHHCMI